MVAERVKPVPDALLADTSVDVVLLSGYGTELPETEATVVVPLPDREMAVPVDAIVSDELESVEVSG
jgi:hypothetical protein